MRNLELRVNFIGPLARTVLSEVTTAFILGITSRGIFLKIADRWVVFISTESQRGPLTLNLERSFPNAGGVDRDEPVQVHDRKIIFPSANLQISYEKAHDWIIPSPPDHVLSEEERDRNIRSVSQQVVRQRGGVGLMLSLVRLLNLEGAGPAGEVTGAHDIHNLYAVLRSSDETQIVEHLKGFLGLGSGLTPSGDDLVSGILLTCNRYEDRLSLPFDLNSINREIILLAYQKTSLLSANLIEAAALGMADERLILALDGMLSGTLDPASCANLFLSWGNSSGGDALLGMALAAYNTDWRK